MKKSFLIQFSLFLFAGILSYGISNAAENANTTLTDRETTVHRISVIHYSGTITAAAADYFSSALEKAALPPEEGGADMAVIALDTPGGLDSSMRVIIKELMNLPIPTAVFVSPQGARAASAGVFITMSAPIAAMAPGTNIGAEATIRQILKTRPD